MTNYWLLKTEPSTFSIFDLQNNSNQTTQWEGIRNYQARNFIKDQMKVGDKVFIYHSVKEPIGIFGTGQIIKQAYPDYFQFDSSSKYYDAKARPEKPIWFMVDLKLEQIFDKPITLAQLKSYNELKEMLVVQKGSRLSVQPVSEKHWNFIYSLSVGSSSKSGS